VRCFNAVYRLQTMQFGLEEFGAAFGQGDL